jgi:hypothetical protein
VRVTVLGWAWRTVSGLEHAAAAALGSVMSSARQGSMNREEDGAVRLR